MFGGEYRHSIDTKGRLMIPARFRDIIAGEGLRMIAVFNKCISVYPEHAFLEHTHSLSTISSTDGPRMYVKRYILSQTRDVSLDPQGRILVGKDLRDKAELKKDVVIVGMDDYFEIWDSELYAEECAKYESPEEMAKKAFELGITL